MSVNVEIKYEDGIYRVNCLGKELVCTNEGEVAMEQFKRIIRDNVVLNSSSWESIYEKISLYSIKDIEINKEFKAITYKDLKYFYNTGKCFYNKDGNMIQLLGGFYTFDFIINLISQEEIEDYKEIVEFMSYIISRKSTFRVNESSLIVGSAAFNYGNCEYNFLNRKILKGATTSLGSFNDFKEYVKGILK